MNNAPYTSNPPSSNIINPTIPLSQSNPQLHNHHQQQQHQQYVFHQNQPNQPQRSLFNQSAIQQQQQQLQQRMMLMGPRGYHSTSTSLNNQQQQQQQPQQNIPSLLNSNQTSSRNLPSNQPQPNRQGGGGFSNSNQWGKQLQQQQQNCVVCNENLNIDLLSLMPCGHRVCNPCCFNDASSHSNGSSVGSMNKCPICSIINNTTNLTSLLSNNNIRDAFNNSQTVSPIGFNPIVATPQITTKNPQTPISSTKINSSTTTTSMDNAFSIWEPLPLLSGNNGGSRTQPSFSSPSPIIYPQSIPKQAATSAIMPPNSSHYQQQQQQQQPPSQNSSLTGSSYYSSNNSSSGGYNNSSSNQRSKLSNISSPSSIISRSSTSHSSSTPIGGGGPHSTKPLQFQFKEQSQQLQQQQRSSSNGGGGGGENNNVKNEFLFQQQQLRGGNNTTTTIKCTNCDEKNMVIGYCLDCKEFLCSDCVMAHARVKITKEHKIQVIDETFNALQQQLQTASSTIQTATTTRTHSDSASIKADSESPNSFTGNNSFSSTATSSCAEHDLFFVSICTTCGGIHLCLKCLQNHSGHNLRILPVYETHVSLPRLLAESRNIQRSLEDSKEGIKRMQERIDASVQSVAGEMRSIIHLHISALEERKRDLLQRVDAIHQTKILTLNQQNEKISEKMMALENIIKFGEQLYRENIIGSAGGGISGQSNLSDSSPIIEEDPRFFECYEKLLKLHSENFIPLIPTANDAIRLRGIDPMLLQSLKNLGNVESGLCPKATQLLGTRFKRAITGRPCVINIQMKDVCGDSVGKESREQGGEFISTLYGPLSGGNASLQHAEIVDRDNGVCSLMFTPKRVGIYRLNVTYCQVPITGCPTEINVCSGRDYKDAQTQGQKFSFGKEGTGDGEFSRPWGICCDLKGRILVADRSNHRIQIFDARGNFLMKFGHRGNRQGEFNRPAGICINPSNDIIVADKDNHRISIFFDNGTFSHGFGSRGCSPGLFNYPWGVCTNNNYEIAVTDTRNHRVQIFNSTGIMLKMCTIDSDIKRSPSSPRGICFLPDNELIVSDFNTHRLAVLNSSGEPRFFGLEGTAPGFFHRPQGIAVDPDGLVLVCDSRSNRIQVLNIYDLTVVAVLGNDTKHSRPDLLTNDKFLDTTLFRPTSEATTTSTSQQQQQQVFSTPNANLLEHPMDVCVSPDGLVYVVDFGNNCIRVY